jgi:hypothetical protein
VPLLVWLGPDGTRDNDGLRYWRLALGDSAAIVAVDPLHLSEEEDLQLGGRWYWTDSFTSDASAVQRGLERLIDYVSRRFPVDSKRVVIAGRGTGATAVLWSAMYTNGLNGVLIAAEPRHTAGLRMAGLPGAKSSITKLYGVVGADGEGAIRGILKDYVDMGIDTDVTVASGAVLEQIEAVVRKSLGVADADRVMTNAAPRPIRLATDTPTSRRWAELYVRSSTEQGTLVDLIDGEGDAELLDFGGVWKVSDLRRPGALPRAPGPFGGTTVLVVPAGGDREAWAKLIADDPLKKLSRFHRSVLAFEDGEPSLPDVLAELKTKGRKNVLIVPAQFCATGDQMRAIRASVGDTSAGMVLRWKPGLGGGLVVHPRRRETRSKTQ